MAKILLVEDDNNLREIYEARLQAEGYAIVSAMDGEEALVIAKKEQPDLIISDVMMPRVSGFEMLDILRNTDGLKDVRVIMLTALGQAEDKTRADALGADRYLVKSQVTLEDIVRAAHELIGPTASSDDATTTVTAPAALQTTTATSPTASAPAVTVAAVPVAAPPQATPAPLAPSEPAVNAPIPVSAPPAPATPPITSAPIVNPVAATASTNTTAASPAAPSVTTSEPTIPTASEPSQVPLPATPSAPSQTTTIPPIEPPAGIPTPTSPPHPPVVTPPAPTPPPIPATQAPEPQPTATAVPAQVETEAPELPSGNEEPATVPVSPAANPAPVASESVPSTQSGVQSTSEEEAAIKAQIERFVSQNDKTAPAPPQPAEDPTHAMMANAIKDLVSDANTTAHPEPSEPKIVQPPAPAMPTPPQPAPPEEVTNPAPATAVTMAASSNQQPAPVTFSPQASQPSVQPAAIPVKQQFGSVPVAHKKVISPITAPGEAPPNLNELLAKEGITNLDGDDEPTPPPAPATPSVSQQQAFTAQQRAFAVDGSPEPSEPHQPGHVITPSAPAGVDPNSIAL